MQKDVSVLLHNIRSTHNVGSIFRTADSFGIKKIYISGYTPSPKDRFGRWRKDVCKVSLGAEKSVEWEEIKQPKKLVEKLKQDGFKVVSIEQSENSMDYKKVKLSKKTLFIIGNEVSGVEAWFLDNSDTVAEIPMLGEKESLNVSVAFAVAVSRMLNI